MCACGLCAEVESLRAEVESLRVNDQQQADRVRYLEKLLDTRATPWWKRVVFRVDGYGPWYRLRPVPGWRPWHRWTRAN